MEFFKTRGLKYLLSSRYAGMGFALADQIAYSASSFLTGVVVGRLLSIGNFGEFSLGLTILIFSIILQDTLLATPYTMRIQREPLEMHPSLRAGAVIQSCLLGAACSVLLLGVSFMITLPGLAGLKPIVASLSLSVPFIFLRECLRRQFFAEFKTITAFVMDVGVSLLQFVLIFVFWQQGVLTSSSVFAAIAIACFTGAIIAWICNRSMFDFSKMKIWEDTLENLRFGRWLLAGSCLHLSSLYVYPWLIFLLHGNIAAGAYAACFNIINLINPFVLGFNNYFRAQIGKTFITDGAAGMDRLVRRTVLFLLPLAMGVVAVTMFGGGWLVRTLYGPEFADLGPVIALLSLSILPTVLNAPLQLGVLAMNKPQINPMFHACALITTVCVGVPLVMHYANIGAASGYALTATASCTLLFILYRMEIRKLR